MTVAQPSGTVTLVFTDIEGSTRLLEELGVDAYRDALAEHRRVVRGACARYAGYEVDYDGDAFFYAFASAQAAVQAVSEAMVGLEASPIRIRVGVHTGEPGLDPPKYVGMDVHRAARVMASGHGGQVVLSQTTRDLLDESFALRDLGEHRLKDLTRPQRLYQLGVTDFPALKTLYRTNLPVPATPFLGREAELAAVVGLLFRENVRLLTLTGPGGTGKTRLALQAAAEAVVDYSDGVWWMPLAPLRDPRLVLPSLAQALEIREEPGRELAETIASRLAGKRLLVLLDNAEHLLPQLAADVAGLLAACPTLTLLVTSRERLRVATETAWPVPPLAPSDAGQLFVERARSAGVVLEADETVVELCRRLDELPLALELAAARTVVFSPEQLLERLGQRLDLFKGGRDADPRQRTLRATIDWSHDLLDADEQRVFRALSVFVGGCTYEAAEHVADADPDALQSLLDKSLLRRRDTDLGPRYWMLESIREYAAERLEDSGGGEEVRSSHAHCFLQLAEAAEPKLMGAAQAAWLERLDLEHENLRAGVSWLHESGRSELELQLVGAVWRLWYMRGLLGEGRSRVEAALASSAGQPAERREKVLLGAALFAHRQGDYEHAAARSDELLTLCRALGDPERVASALLAVGLMAVAVGDNPHAKTAYLECADFARQGEHRETLAMVIANLGDIALSEGDTVQARHQFEESLALFRELGEAHGIAGTLSNLADVAVQEARHQDAEALLHESLQLAQVLLDKEVMTWCFDSFAALAASRREGDRAAVLLGAAEILRQETGHAPQPSDRQRNEQTRNILAAGFDAKTISVAEAIGREMTLDEAIAFALSS